MSLRHVILTLLSQEPHTGYEIVKSFDQSVGYFWQASHQQVYRELGVLADKGWVSFTLKHQSDKPDKKTYRVTRSGKIELTCWLERPLSPPPNKDALLVKLMNIEQTNPSVLITELEASQHRTLQTLANYKEIKENFYTPAPDKNWPVTQQMLYLALRKGIVGAETRLAWLDEALSVVHSLK